MKHTLLILMAILLVGGGLYWWQTQQADNPPSSNNTTVKGVPELLSSSFPDTNFEVSTIDLSLVLSGGPGVDGIPAINDPTFEPITNTAIDDEVQAILVDLNNEKRLYPYNILVWHEIVNDTIGDQDIAVTFCPLCGSAIVFDRTLNGEAVEFGVSGLLYESNMIMYDRTDSPSLWSQSLGEAITGEKAGQQLDHIPSQLITLDEAKQLDKDIQIMQEPVDYSRDYDVYPYGDYDENETFVFQPSTTNREYPIKEIFYIIPGEESVAIRISKIDKGEQVTNYPLVLQVNKGAFGEITVTDLNDNIIPGYYEMWFSWAVHHAESGIVWDPSE